MKLLNTWVLTSSNFTFDLISNEILFLRIPLKNTLGSKVPSKRTILPSKSMPPFKVTFCDLNMR